MHLNRLYKLLAAVSVVLCLSMPAETAEPGWIFGVHDTGGYATIEQAGKRGWIVVTVGIGHNPTDYSGDDFRFWSNRGHGVIVRLNNGYGSDGTLPLQSQYQSFATRCANYVAATQGADIFIIGNETNLPREWPGNVDGNPATGEPITVARYVDCYNRCYTAIKGVRSTTQVCPTPSGTWAPPYAAQGIEEFDEYWYSILNTLGATKVDALIIHAYTHGCDPALVTSNAKMGDPYTDIFYNFRVYRNYLQRIKTQYTAFAAKPVYITECDQNIECADGPPQPKHTWNNSNNGWVKALYSEINTWNNTAGNQRVRCVVLFRWDDVAEGEWNFGFSLRSGVITDWLEAMANDYRWDTGLKGTIAGYVRDSSSQGISGATVTTSPGGHTATSSGSSGYYTITNVPIGTYDVTASKTGYGRQTLAGKVVNANQTTTASFSLPPAVAISTAKGIADGLSALISGTVTARFPVGGNQDRIYVENSNRTCGIAVLTGTVVSVGDVVEAQGSMATSNGEKVLNASSVFVAQTGTAVPVRVGLNGRALGGGAFGQQGAVINDATAVTYSSGLSNVGLLVRAWGKVSHVDPGGAFFYLDDGTGLTDGSGWPGVRVACSVLPLPVLNSNVVVTGISGTSVIGGKTARLLRPRSAGDLSYAAGVNYLSNPGFELGTLAGWTTYGSVDGVQTGAWFGDIVPHTGTKYVGSAAHGGTKTGGLYQRVAVTNGVQYQGKVWSRVFHDDNAADSAQSRVGMDPTGGTDPLAASVHWSAWDTQSAEHTSVWRELSTPIAACAGGYVTVFLDYKQLNAVGWHINCFDDAGLYCPAQ